MTDDMSGKKPMVVSDDNKAVQPEVQSIVYHDLARKLQAARFAENEVQREQEESSAEGRKANEYKNNYKKWTEKTERTAALTAQTLPATLLMEIMELAEIYGALIDRNVRMEVKELGGELNKSAKNGSLAAALIVGLPREVREFMFNRKSDIIRKISGDGQLALPELSLSFRLEENGCLKIDPVSKDQLQFTDEATLKRLNDTINQCGMAWLETKNYEFFPNEGCFYKKDCPEPHQDADRLMPDELVKLATNTEGGLDAYLLQQCGVIFQIKPTLTEDVEQEESLAPRPCPRG